MGYVADQLKKQGASVALPVSGTTPSTAAKGTTAPRPSGDLTTVPGLEATAQSAGLGKKVAALPKVGEDPKRIFSGGFISDVFDVLSALQYGVTGTIKGKGFVEGIKTRQSFSDKDALGEYGLPGAVAGIAADIAVDPLTYLGGFGILSKAYKGVKGLEAVQKASKVASSTKLGNKMGSMFIYRFGQDPIYKEMAKRSERTIAASTRNLVDLAKPIAKLDPLVQQQIANARKLGKLEELPAELLEKAKPAFDELDRLGKEAVDAGLLKKSVYDENVGKYMARLYRKFETPDAAAAIKGVRDAKPLRAILDRFKSRKDIPDDVRAAMGEIMEAGYPTAKALVQIKQAVERTRFFKEVGEKFAKDVAEDGMKILPKSPRLGGLSGKAVPEPIFDDIQEIIRTKTDFEKTLGKAVAGFKFGKVILNPATHARNVMSNMVLNNFEGLSPARMDVYLDAAKELKNKGKFYQEAKAVGLGADTFASQELKALLTSPEAVGAYGKTKKAFAAAADKIADIYQKEEEWAKMAMFIFQRKKGLTAEAARDVAERATFNYAQVTPFIRRVRESIFGLPFITFTYKATPQIARTAITKPTKISNIGKIRTAIENQSDPEKTARERATEPEWVRDGFYVKLPIEDKHGRSAYLDLTYILPFGDLLSGNYLERDVERTTGLPETPATAVLKKAPLPNLVRELATNQDFNGNAIVKKSDPIEKQMTDIFRHLLKTYLPPAVGEAIPSGYRASGDRRPSSIGRVLDLEEKGFAEVEAGGKQSRTLMQELLRQVGLRIQPVDVESQESFSETNRKKALETLLRESGVTAEFKRQFIPKSE